MPVTLKKQRDGDTYRDFWYGDYLEDGQRKVINLDVPWKGLPPTSLRGEGNPTFERSRAKAEERLSAYVEEARAKGRAVHINERLLEAKTGEKPEYVRLEQLPDRWAGIVRADALSETYRKSAVSMLNRFVDFIRERNPRAGFLYQVKPADAGAFAIEIRDSLSPKSYQEYMRLLRPAFDRFLPVGSVNPFSSIAKAKKGADGVNGGSIHRKPFTAEELEKLIAEAQKHDYMLDLIITAACTGSGDVDVAERLEKQKALAALTRKIAEGKGL